MTQNPPHPMPGKAEMAYNPRRAIKDGSRKNPIMDSKLPLDLTIQMEEDLFDHGLNSAR